MKDVCCACGNMVRFSILRGDQGIRLADGCVCYKCLRKAGYKNGFSTIIKLSGVTVDEFMTKLVHDPRENNISNISLSNHEERDYTQLTDEQLQEEIKKYIIPKPGMMLREGEICYFAVPCKTLRFKNVVVGTSTKSNHIGVGNDGLYLGSGFSYKSMNRENVAEEYQGYFYMTNQRMVCNSVKLSFEIKLTDITTMTRFVDGLTIMAKGKTHIVSFNEVDQFKDLISINNEIMTRLQDDKNTTSKKSGESNESKNTNEDNANIPKLIREYKDLLDDGIITQEEFDKKKAELLFGRKSQSDLENDESVSSENSSDKLAEYIRCNYTKKEKIDAIKYVRDKKGCSLNEAKVYIDSIL